MWASGPIKADHSFWEGGLEEAGAKLLLLTDMDGAVMDTMGNNVFFEHQ